MGRGRLNEEIDDIIVMLAIGRLKLVILMRSDGVCMTSTIWLLDLKECKFLKAIERRKLDRGFELIEP